MSGASPAAISMRAGSAPDRPPSGRARRGTDVALYSVARLLVPLTLAAATVPGCITENIPINATANFPASIESTSTAMYPLSEVILLEPTAVTDGGTPEIQPFDLEVIVRDPDVAQELEYQLYVDRRTGGGDSGGPIPASTSGDRRLRTLRISTADVIGTLSGSGCHRIEVRISEAFLPGSPVPVTTGDLGTAVWWVATPNALGEVEMTTCGP